MITFTINGQTIQTEPGKSVMEIAHKNGIDIPHLCWYPGLSASGGCRLCLVEVAGWPNPVPACGLAAADGMAVTTHSDKLYAMRRGVLDLIFADHPLDCVICEKAGICELQNYAYEYNISETSYNLEVSHPVYEQDNPFYIRDHQYCILCGRCVRMCDEVTGVHAIDFAHRGYKAYIATPFDRPLPDTDCIFCGNCVQACPTAALLPVSRLGKGREWEFRQVTTVCEYCGVGCKITLHLKGNRIIRVDAPVDQAPNYGELCVKGRFGHEYLWHKDRLTTPLIRRDGELQPATWDEALDLIAEKIQTVKAESGPEAIGFLCSAKCTNEENYLLQKIARQVVGTHSVDHCARL